MDMREKVARALALCEGGKITGPGRHRASDEFGWKMDGEHLDQFVEKHWRTYVNAAGFAIEAMRDPTDGMRMAGHAALDMSAHCEPHIGAQVGLAALRDVWQAMIDESLAVGDGQLTQGSKE